MYFQSIILLFFILIILLVFILVDLSINTNIKGGSKKNVNKKKLKFNTVDVNKKKLKFNTVDINKKKLNTTKVNNSRNYNYTHISENISDKIICNWSILKNTPPKDNYNVISVVFFLRKHLTTGKDDKEINRYVNGIKRILFTFNLIDGFILRIYFDISVKSILHNIFDHTSDEIFNNVELYQYDIPILKDGNNHHRGLLGMIIRFFPLFDIPLHKVDRCLILDIDNNIHSFFNDIINICDNRGINFCHKFLYGYVLKEHAYYTYINFNQKTPLEKYLFNYSIICSFIYQNNINFSYVPKLILSNFLNLFITSNAGPSSTNDLFNKLKKINLINFEYGFDEIFMNKIYFEHLYNNPSAHISTIHNTNSNFVHIILIYINFIKYVDKKIENLNILINFIKKLYKIFNINTNLNNINNLEKLYKYLIYYIYNDKNFIYIHKMINNINHANLNIVNNFLDSEIIYYSNNHYFLILLNSIKSLLNFYKNNHIFIIDIKKTNNNFIEDKYIYIHT